MKIEITENDLNTLYSMAVQTCISLSQNSRYHKDNNKLRSYSFAEAMVNLLNSKNVVQLEVKIDKGYSEE